MTPAQTPGLDEFNRHLDDPGLLASMTFLRGHLLLEQALTRILELRAVDASALRLDRQTFASKLNICRALGFVPEDLAGAIGAVNRERNRLAHRLDAKVDRESLQALVNGLPRRIRVSIDAVIAAAPDTTDYMRAAAHGDLRAMGLPAVEAAIDLYISGAAMKLTMQALFLVLAMGLGHEVLLAEYRKEHGDRIMAFELACAMQDDPPSADKIASIRENLGLPPEPDPRDALSALFGGSET
ncbi:hypothetical protein [Microbacterium sp. CPCC 204701]|uniref:hypothetical protein n=1 Tax=Microbacterium sp. CPCC 204701 TaxID=2493084 RepID=UPI000FD74B27|nr:hypothetical protein [Microbacterium sp. CPCC 204701]